jgi:antitoxin MazE
MHTEIKKWGNSAVIRIPATMLEELRLKVGSPIELKHENGQLIIEPVRPVRAGWFEAAPVEDQEALGGIPADEGDEDWQW